MTTGNSDSLNRALNSIIENIYGRSEAQPMTPWNPTQLFNTDGPHPSKRSLLSDAQWLRNLAEQLTAEAGSGHYDGNAELRLRRYTAKAVAKRLQAIADHIDP